MYYKKKKNLLHPDLIRKVLLSVRQIYVVGLSSCCICIMVTLGFRLGHLWDTCTWSQRHYGSLPITPSQLILPIKKSPEFVITFIRLFNVSWMSVYSDFIVYPKLLFGSKGILYWGPTDYCRWLVVGCNPFRPSLSKTPLGYAHLPEDRQHGRWTPPSPFGPL